MPKLIKHIFTLCILVLGSCNLISKESCGTLETDENFKIDSLIGDLNSALRIHSLSLELKGGIEQDILFNDIKLKSGKVDTVINNIDQYSSTFIYEIHNPRNGKIQLDICADFHH